MDYQGFRVLQDPLEEKDYQVNQVQMVSLDLRLTEVFLAFRVHMDLLVEKAGLEIQESMESMVLRVSMVTLVCQDLQDPFFRPGSCWSNTARQLGYHHVR